MTVTAETSTEVASAGHEGDPAGVRWLIFARDRGIFVLWALLLLAFSLWASPYFASLDNALLIANAAALTAIFAAGIAVGIICGALDLSIPGTAAMAGCVCGWTVEGREDQRPQPLVRQRDHRLNAAEHRVHEEG